MSTQCAKCKLTVQVGQRFCANCGVPLAQAASPPPANDMAEHRQLTIIFSDIVSSTYLTEKLGSESFREMLRQLRESAGQSFGRYGSHIARYFGDGTLVYFGYPEAHEADAQRAVQGSLELLASVRELEQTYLRNWGVGLGLRIAVHTGMVVAGDIRSETAVEEVAVIGTAANVAAHMQALAEPGTLIISETTYRLVRHAFDCTQIGTPTLKGLSTPMPIYRVNGQIRGRTKADAWDTRTSLVGRETELGALRDGWSSVAAGRGKLVLIHGEAGVGKTRLVSELAAELDRRPTRQILFQCSPLYQNTALHPCTEYLLDEMGLTRGQDPEVVIPRLEEIFAAQGLDSADYVPVLAPLLGIALPPARYPPLNITPQQHRERLHERLGDWLLHEAGRTQVLLVVEDLHWADPSTVELLAQTAPRLLAAPVLLVLTSRSADGLGWLEGLERETLRLERLEEADARMLIELVAEGHALPAETIERLRSKTDGVPLFIEEMTRSVLEVSGAGDPGGAAGSSPLAIPSTLQESLAGRIDRAAVNREILQLSATLGREFDLDVLAAVWGGDRRALVLELEKLVRAELLMANEGAGSSAKYLFRHALIQETIYYFQLSGQRRSNHSHIASVLSGQFAKMFEHTPELIAGHHLGANEGMAALPFLQDAAKRAVERSANVEAAHHLRTALDIVRALPAGPEQLRMELALLTSLGIALSARQGFASDEVGIVYARAREVCEAIGRSARLFPVLHGLYRFYFVRADINAATALSTEMTVIAWQTGERALLLEAHRSAGNCRFLSGQFDKASFHFDRAAALYDADLHRRHRFDYGTDPFVVSKSMNGLAVRLSDRPDRAYALTSEAIEAAETLNHPYSLCWALTIAALLYQLSGDHGRMVACCHRVLENGRTHGFQLWVLSATITLGWHAFVNEGDAQGIEMMRDGIAGWQETGAIAYVPYFLALLGEAHLQAGSTAEAESVIVLALRTAEAHGELWWVPELHRLRAEILLANAATNKERAIAKSHLLRALSLAIRHRSALQAERARRTLDHLLGIESRR